MNKPPLEPKNCPFCNCPGAVVDGDSFGGGCWVGCVPCDVGFAGEVGETEKMLGYWNRRTSPSQDPVTTLERVERELRRLIGAEVIPPLYMIREMHEWVCKALASRGVS